MKLYICAKCKRGLCPRRKSNQRMGDILEMGETITHENGTKERTIWAKINEKTNEIISAKFI